MTQLGNNDTQLQGQCPRRTMKGNMIGDRCPQRTTKGNIIGDRCPQRTTDGNMNGYGKLRYSYNCPKKDASQLRWTSMNNSCDKLFSFYLTRYASSSNMTNTH